MLTDASVFLEQHLLIASSLFFSWLSNNEAAAGFSNNIFLRLQEKIERGEQAYCYCTLIVPDTSLQKQQEWDPQMQHRTGSVDLGAGVIDADEAPLASEVIMVMEAGISRPRTAPLGYFVNSMTSYLLSCFVRPSVS